jgi:hypothetical protein
VRRSSCCPTLPILNRRENARLRAQAATEVAEIFGDFI